MAGHALCNAHLLRELTAVTETGTADDVIWAGQAIDALLALKKAAGAARDAGQDAIDPEILASTATMDFRDAAAAGIASTPPAAASCRRNGTPWPPGCATAPMTISGSPMTCGFPFDNNEAEQVIRMSKLRIKVSGCMRSMHGAEIFCTIRSYLATATRHGIGVARRPHASRPGQPLDPRNRRHPRLKREPCQKPVTQCTNANTTAEGRPIQLLGRNPVNAIKLSNRREGGDRE